MLLSEKINNLKQFSNVGNEGFGSCFVHAKEYESLLKEAAELFRFYEDSHRKRGPEHLEKAERNAEIATRIEAVLNH